MKSTFQTNSHATSPLKSLFTKTKGDVNMLQARQDLGPPTTKSDLALSQKTFKNADYSSLNNPFMHVVSPK